MLEARAMAGEHWDADSEQQLAKYRVRPIATHCQPLS